MQWRIGQVQTLFRVCIHFMFRPIAFGSAMGKPSQGNQGKCKQGKSQVVLLHISQVRRCVRKMRKMQVDVSSLFFVKNIVRFASVFYVSGVALKYVEELHGPLLLILELVTNYVGFVLDQAWALLRPLRWRPLRRHRASLLLPPRQRTAPSHGCLCWHHGPHPPCLTLVSRGLLLPSRPLRGRWRQVGYLVVFFFL